MTGLDCLRKEMMAHGLTKQQAESKAATVALDILCGANGRYSDMDKIQAEIKLLEQRKETLWDECRQYEIKINACMENLETITQDVNKITSRAYDETVKYIHSFFDALNTFETPEARDTLKIAQMFANTVNVDTKYDNTAFIIGLASILTHGNITPIDELRKINKKIPRVEFEAKPYVRYTGNKEWIVQIQNRCD